MSWSILSILQLMRYSNCLLSFDRFGCLLFTFSLYLTKVINIMSPFRIRRPDDFHVHLRDGNSMV